MSQGPSRAELLRWSEALSAIARTGLGFTKSLYERERYEEVLKVAADIRVAADEILFNSGRNDHAELDVGPQTQEEIVQEWIRTVKEGVAGYVTPKVAVGAVVPNEHNEILLVKRADSGVWLYPTGWADPGYSASEVASKEVLEETGIIVEPVRLVAVLDGLRLGFAGIALYSLIFACRQVGGELKAHPLECSDVGWFPMDDLPAPLAGVERWGKYVFAALRGDHPEVFFDPPRSPEWRS